MAGPRHMRRRGTVARCVLAAAAGLALAAAFLLLLFDIPGMLIRRDRISDELAGERAAAAALPEMGYDADPSYEMLHTGRYGVAFRAVTESLDRDVSDRNTIQGTGGLSVLPFLITSTCRDSAETMSVNRTKIMAQEAMMDDPVRSLLTCGQGFDLGYVGSSYRIEMNRGRLAVLESDDGRDSLREQAVAVGTAADGIARTVKATCDGDRTQMVHEAYALVSSGCTYADGFRDTAHFNDVYGALVEGESECYGMAGAMRMVLRRLGVPSIMLLGQTGGGGRHAIVAALIGGKWEAIDVTMCCGMSYEDVLASLDDAGEPGISPLSRYIHKRQFRIDDDCKHLLAMYSASVPFVDDRWCSVDSIDAMLETPEGISPTPGRERTGGETDSSYCETLIRS